jgi:hypothetical protein
VSEPTGYPLVIRTDSGKAMLRDKLYRHAVGHVTAIEAEARSLLLDELEAAVRGLEHPPKWFPFSQSDILDRSDVLALIQQHREAIR